MKRPKYLQGLQKDTSKVPPIYQYYKTRDGTALECARLERKLARRRPEFYKQLRLAAEKLGVRMKKSITQALKD